MEYEYDSESDIDILDMTSNIDKTDISNDLLSIIFSYLDIQSLINCNEIIQWQSASSLNSLWKNIYEYYNLHIDNHEIQNRDYKQNVLSIYNSQCNSCNTNLSLFLSNSNSHPSNKSKFSSFHICKNGANCNKYHYNYDSDNGCHILCSNCECPFCCMNLTCNKRGRRKKTDSETCNSCHAYYHSGCGSMNYCMICEDHYCNGCKTNKYCCNCRYDYCNDCDTSDLCNRCIRNFCSDCILTCNICKLKFCPTCNEMFKCSSCKRFTCNACDSNPISCTLCRSIYCIPCGIDSKEYCQSCEIYICKKHISSCISCLSTFCILCRPDKLYIEYPTHCITCEAKSKIQYNENDLLYMTP